MSVQGAFSVQKSGLDEITEHSWPQIWMLRQILCIHSHSEVYRYLWWSKCQEIDFKRNIYLIIIFYY